MTDPTLDSILDQDDWLKRVAHALVRDRHLAEDLAQDAWVVGLGQGRVTASERSWFTGVLFNSARAVFRKEGRDRRHAPTTLEGSMAPASMAPATDDVVAELQLREQVARALLELDEPYRTTLHMRYIAGHPVKEIAARMGVAPSTVTERVDRGLTRLRKKLDLVGGGDRHAWLAPMVALAGRAESTGVGIGAGSGAAVLVACGVAAVWAGMWWDEHREEPGTRREPLTATLAGADERAGADTGRGMLAEIGYSEPEEPAWEEAPPGSMDPLPAPASPQLHERRIRVTEGGAARPAAAITVTPASAAGAASRPAATDERGWTVIACAAGSYTFVLPPRDGVGESKAITIDWPLPDDVTVIAFP